MKRLENLVVSDITEITTVYSTKGRQYETKSRGSYGLSFCQSGRIVYTIGNKEVVSDPSCAVILPPYTPYRLYGEKDGYFPLVNFAAATNVPLNDIIKIPVSNTEFYTREFSKLKQSRLFNHSRFESMHILYKLLDQLSVETKKRHPSLDTAIAYIEENFSDPTLSNTRISAYANISEVYLRKLFSSEIKCTPKQYIINIRLQKAKQLLQETNQSIGEIAEQCGFSNSYHFCRAFKCAVNMTPSQYRLASYATSAHLLI